MAKQKKVTQGDIIMEYFLANPDRDIPTPKAVDWATETYQNRAGKKFRDPDRAIRLLHAKGSLIKVKKGLYRYEPEATINRSSDEFSAIQKEKIKHRDKYKCVVCGKGVQEGVELHVDHIKSRSSGGKATIKNGQTLCGQHNYIKKNLSQTEAAKKMMILFYEKAKKERSQDLLNFFSEILEVYEKHSIDDHIKWIK